ncbi:MAG: hypothetical protein DMF43_03220 [Verrucomicrobia bacterium]|nr:MAG: hypothetical protein DMF43_03220 [Verrucomicrobiota bacterium]
MIRTVVFIIAFSLCVSAVWAKDEKSIKKLRDALVALAPDVDPGEAELLSVTAHTASRSLAREYGLVWCPAFQNVLIHTGRRQRGYCGHYTRDIGERLKALKLKTLVLHWGAAYAGTLDENNGLVITAAQRRPLILVPTQRGLSVRLGTGGSLEGNSPRLLRGHGMERRPTLHGLVAGLRQRSQMAVANDGAITC